MLAQAQDRIERFLQRQRRWVWSGLFIALAVLYLSSASNELAGNLGGDNAHYLLLAKALAQGRGYVDLYLPDHPPHTKYPPLFPLLLAPFTWLGRFELWSVHLFIAGLGLVVPFALAGWVRRQGYSETACLAMLLLTATLPRYYEFLFHVLSDIPFTAFCYLALWGMARSRIEFKPRDLALITAAALAAFFTRTAGIALAAAIGMELIRRSELRGLRSGRLPWWLIFGAVMGLAFLTWSFRNRSVGGAGVGYFQELLLKDPSQPQAGYVSWIEFGSRFCQRAYFYLTFMGMQVSLGKTVFTGKAAIQPQYLPWLIPVGIGFLSRLRQPERSAEWFFVFSALMMSCWWYPDSRFLIPMLPLASFYLILGVRRIFGWMETALRLPAPRARALTAGVGLVLLGHQVWIVAGIVRHQHRDRFEPSSLVYLPGYGMWHQPVINWAKYETAFFKESEIQLFTRGQIIYRIAAQKVPPEKVILSGKPTITAWFAERPSVGYIYTEDVKAQWEHLRRNRVSWVLALYPNPELDALFKSCPDCFRPVVSFQEGYPALFEVANFPDHGESSRKLPY